MVRDEVRQVKIYKSDLKFLNYLSEVSRRPRIHLLSLAVSLLALAVLRADEVYRLYEEEVRDYEKEGNE